MYECLLPPFLLPPSQFMEQMVAVYGERAREAGVYLVSACGFDCIPNDLGALMLQQHFVGQLAYVDSYMAVSNVGMSLGVGVAAAWASQI